MNAGKVLSAFIALMVSIPLVLIPSTYGISIEEGVEIVSRGNLPKDPAVGSVFLLLEAYYIFFILTNIIPFIFLVSLSFFSMSAQKHRRKALRKKMSKTDGGGSRKSGLFSEKAHPKISLVIPCYNEGQYIGKTIANCHRQNYPGELEIIVVDDGSTDRTWSIGNIFASVKGDRTVKIFHKKNQGKASALELGISRSTGRIIIMTDGDSELQPNAVHEIVETFREHPDAGIVGGYVFIKNTDSGYLTKLQQIEYITTQNLVRMNQSEDGSVLIAPGPIFGMRADLARLYPPMDRTVVEDCDLTMSLLPTGWTTRSTTTGVAYTAAPENWRRWGRQRRRWIFGQFQAWRENRWHLKRNPWGLYTYFIWVSTSISALFFLISTLLTFFMMVSGSDYYRFAEFLSVRSVLIVSVYFIARTIILLRFPEGRKLIHYLPLMVIYDLVNGFLTGYLYARYLTGTGVMLRWGHRQEVIH